jgi:hypothetical protein
MVVAPGYCLNKNNNIVVSVQTRSNLNIDFSRYNCHESNSKNRITLFLTVIQSDHKKTPQLISFLFEIRFQRAVHQIKGFMMYYKLDIKCCP